MNQALELQDAPEISSDPVITPEGRFFRVSVLRRGRVESYLCETEAEARRWATLLCQPATEAQRGPRRPARSPTGIAAAAERIFGLVRMPNLRLKVKP